MTMHAATGCLDVAVNTRKELDAALDEAIELLKPAMTEQVGISVTRLAPGRYEARLDRDVPAGVTIEKWGKSRDERTPESSLRCTDQQRV
jgi:hypothetical protein